LTAQERKVLLAACQRGPTVKVSRRAQVVLLLAAGYSWRDLHAVAFVSNDLIQECLRRWQRGRAPALLEEGRQPQPLPAWLARVLIWVTQCCPQDFGYFRTRWSCETLAETLAWETGIRLSAETVRRGLHRLGWRWRRPRPVLAPVDPRYREKVRRIRRLLARLAPDETAVFQDEVDVHLNPKIGNCWMPRGQQATVVTPGNNEKRHVAGSLHWRTGGLLVSPPQRRRDSRLFVNHLDDLRRRLRGFRRIHVICDNAAFHRSQAVWRYLARWNHRLQLHFLPNYAPQTNPIERVWWNFHESVTRNHRCRTLNELLHHATEWFASTRHHFYQEMRNLHPIAA
jgi:putative transposase